MGRFSLLRKLPVLYKEYSETDLKYKLTQAFIHFV